MSLHLLSRRRAAAVAAAALLSAFLAITLLGVPSSNATTNPDNYDCRGHIEAGDPAPGDEDPQVRYIFGCSGPLTGYQIQVDQPIGSFDSAPIVVDGNKAPVVTDSFTCNGDVPGLAVNCVGTSSGVFVNNYYETVIGQFSIGNAICTEPRPDALLTVVYATADNKGKVTQHIAGPYDLGRPRGCKPSSGHRRIPKGGLTLGDSTTKAKPKARAKSKKKTAKQS